MLGENKCSLFRCRCHNSRIDYYLSFSFWITSSTFFLSFSLSVSGVQFITLSKLFGCLYLILIYNIEQKYNIVLFDEFSKLNLLQTDQIKYEESISFVHVHFEHLSWLHLQSWRSCRLNASVKATIQVNREMHHRLCRELRNVKFAILMFSVTNFSHYLQTVPTVIIESLSLSLEHEAACTPFMQCKMIRHWAFAFV